MNAAAKKIIVADPPYVLRRHAAFSKRQVILDLERLQKDLGRVTYHKYKLHGNCTITSVEALFGTWNAALKAASCSVSHRFWTDAECLQGIKAVWNKLRREPTYDEYRIQAPKLGCPSVSTIEKRFETYRKAILRFVLAQSGGLKTEAVRHVGARNLIRPHVTGKPLFNDHMMYEPTTESAVVFLFGSLAKELGFIVESIRPGFPDCSAKRLEDGKEGRYSPVLIEFELESSNYLTHGHPIPTDADQPIVVICWEDDWKDRPASIEIVSLKDYLAKRIVK